MVLSAAAITGCTRTAATTAGTTQAADEAAARGDAAASPQDGAQAGQPTSGSAASDGAEPGSDEATSAPGGTVPDPVTGSADPDASGPDDSSAPPESGSGDPGLRDPSEGRVDAPSRSADPGPGGPAESAPPGEQDDEAEEPGDDGTGDGVDLDVREHTVVSLLAAARESNGAPRLEIDPGLVVAARDHACTIAQGGSPLVPEEDGENVGLVVEPEPDAAGRAMHNWWMQSEQPRAIRLASGFTRYGVGACTIDDRTYYAERFAS